MYKMFSELKLFFLKQNKSNGNYNQQRTHLSDSFFLTYIHVYVYIY